MFSYLLIISFASYDVDEVIVRDHSMAVDCIRERVGFTPLEGSGGQAECFMNPGADVQLLPPQASCDSQQVSDPLSRPISPHPPHRLSLFFMMHNLCLQSKQKFKDYQSYREKKENVE